MRESRKADRRPPEPGPPGALRRLGALVALDAGNRVVTLLAAFMIAFASVFLMVGWAFGPQVMLRAHEYRAFTGRVDARIVESWLALEFDPGSVRNPAHWRASTQAARCAVVEYSGEWGAPLRRGFCGIRVPFNDSYALADLHDISPGVPFAWPRDDRGLVIPEIRMAPTTRAWLAAHEPDRFMHPAWPAKDAIEWLRVELDQPLDHAAYGWSAGPAILPLAFDPAHPETALPAGTVARRVDQDPSLPAMIVGFGVGLFIWFKATALLPLLSGITSLGRWVFSGLLLASLPWWMEAMPGALAHVNRDLATVVGDMFSDIGRIDRLLVAGPGEATLEDGERMRWRLEDSVYLDTFGMVVPMPPATPIADGKPAFEAIAQAVKAKVRALDDARRGELFERLARDRKRGLEAVAPAFRPAAREAVDSPQSSATTRRAAQRFLE